MAEWVWTRERVAKLKMLVKSGVHQNDLAKTLGMPKETPISFVRAAINRHLSQSDRDAAARIRANEVCRAEIRLTALPTGSPVSWGAFMGSTPFPSHLAQGRLS